MAIVLSNDILVPMVKEGLRHRATVTIPLKGFSMRPYLEDQRDKAMLIPVPEVSSNSDAGEESLKVGDVILAGNVGPMKKYALHRIVAISGDEITMYGDGNFSPEHIHRSDVVAKACGFYINDSKELSSTDTLSYKIYWRTWVALRPFRRYLLLTWRLWKYPAETLQRIANKLHIRTTNVTCNTKVTETRKGTNTVKETGTTKGIKTTKDKDMKLRPGLMLNQTCGQWFVVPMGELNIDMTNIIALNETSLFIWKEMEKGPFTLESLVKAMMEEYEVEEEVVTKDIANIIEMFKGKSLLCYDDGRIYTTEM